MLSKKNIYEAMQFGVNDKVNTIPLALHGNRCGHDPTIPRFYLTPAHHKPRPTLLEGIKKGLKEVYHKPKRFFKKLVTAHDNNRQVSSERREAVVAVAQVIVEHVDLGSLKVGFPTAKGFQSLSLEYLGKQTNFATQRIQRAIQDMFDEGYLDIARQVKRNADGTFKSLPSIRKVTTKFFTDAGADLADVAAAIAWKRREKQKADQALKKKTNKENQQKLNKTIQAIISLGGEVVSSITKKKSSYRYNPVTDPVLIRRASELHKANPTRSPGDYLKELIRKKE